MPRMIRLRRAHMPFCWFCHEVAQTVFEPNMTKLKIDLWTQQRPDQPSLKKTLLRECPAWSKSWLGLQVVLLVLACSSLFCIVLHVHHYYLLYFIRNRNWHQRCWLCNSRNREIKTFPFLKKKNCEKISTLKKHGKWHISVFTSDTKDCLQKRSMVPVVHVQFVHVTQKLACLDCKGIQKHGAVSVIYFIFSHILHHHIRVGVG